MFISALDLFKVGIGPSSSHTLGPMLAAYAFLQSIASNQLTLDNQCFIQCVLKGSLAFTGKGHATDRAVLLGLNGYLPQQLVDIDIDVLIEQLAQKNQLDVAQSTLQFNAQNDIIFDIKETLSEHPNGMVFNVLDKDKTILLSQTYFSVGGGFILTKEDISQLEAPLKIADKCDFPHGFETADDMLAMAKKSDLSIAQMKLANEQCSLSVEQLNIGLDDIWLNMQNCVETGLASTGILPGGLNIKRRAADLNQQLKQDPENATLNDWLCAYAMAVNEENAAGHMVVTAPTNGAAGVIPAILYYVVKHQHKSLEQVREFLLTASAIGGLIKHLSSISGAEVGCQGEVGSASAMAAAGLCAINGGTPEQVENAAEIALEHHLGLTCDPVKGLVQVPCIERNGFGAIKAFTASSLALHGSGTHFMSLDRCIRAMKQTGLEMSYKFKETSLGGLAVSNTEC